MGIATNGIIGGGVNSLAGKFPNLFGPRANKPILDGVTVGLNYFGNLFGGVAGKTTEQLTDEKEKKE